MDPLRVGHCNAPVWTDQPRQSEDQHGKFSEAATVVTLQPPADRLSGPIGC